MAIQTTERARLPAVYEAAKTALAECSRIDECRDWADRAAALASYARQANDRTLLEHAARIQNRAVRRLGELSGQIDGRPGARTDIEPKPPDGPRLKLQLLQEKDVSRRQAQRAEDVAAIPVAEFDRLVDGPSPPTVKRLAEIGAQYKREQRGTPSAPLTESDLDARKVMGQLTTFASFCQSHDPRDMAQRVPLDRVQAARHAVATLDSWLDRFVTNLRISQ